MKQSRSPPEGGGRADGSRNRIRALDRKFFTYTPPQAAEREAREMTQTQKAVLFVRSSKRAPCGEDSLRTKEKAGRAFARRSGLRIARTWAVGGGTRREDRRTFRSFLEAVKGDPAIEALLFERPEQMSRRPKDLVTLHDLAHTTGREIRFFGADHEMNACLHFQIMVTLMRQVAAYRHESAGRKSRTTSVLCERAGGRR